MALETNARIPSPYVYQPVDFGGKIDAEAANKAAALKAGVQAKKDLKTKNDAALAVKPTWTTEGVLNGAIENKANQIRDTYSKMAAAGIPIWDATTPEGSAFAEEIASLNKFSNEMKGYEQDINEIEGIKGADQDAYKFYVEQIGKAKDPSSVDAIVTDYRENKELLAKAPDNRKIVDETVGRVPLDTEVADIKAAALNMKQIDLKKEIPSDKIQPIIDKIKTSNESQLEEKLFNFKKDKGIPDAEFDQYTDYDDYLADKVRTAVALRANVGVQVKGTMTINVNNAGGSNETNTGNTGISGPGNVGYQFNSIGIPENVGGVFMMPINVSDDAIKNTGAAIENRAGQNYVKLEDLWRFEDKDNPHSKILLDWVWTEKQAKDKTWKPDQGRYYTIDNKEVVGKPSNIIWDQDGNGWANIDSGSGKNVKVLIYPKTPDIYGSQSDVTNNSKSNAKQLLVTFDEATPKGTLDSKAMSDPWGTVNNIFNRKTGLVTDIE
jgi:hypothetical protein